MSSGHGVGIAQGVLGVLLVEHFALDHFPDQVLSVDPFALLGSSADGVLLSPAVQRALDGVAVVLGLLHPLD